MKRAAATILAAALVAALAAARPSIAREHRASAPCLPAAILIF